MFKAECAYMLPRESGYKEFIANLLFEPNATMPHIGDIVEVHFKDRPGSADRDVFQARVLETVRRELTWPEASRREYMLLETHIQKL
jgi:hypothetical protein